MGKRAMVFKFPTNPGLIIWGSDINRGKFKLKPKRLGHGIEGGFLGVLQNHGPPPKNWIWIVGPPKIFKIFTQTPKRFF